jgi:hypothetical protein
MTASRIETGQSGRAVVNRRALPEFDDNVFRKSESYGIVGS